ncbi:hypothetical protein PIB30_032902 [Stylosanthes scabra]|uniref:Gnk2-homologous domain-containing protein n=1 Tax=Stylosanthes scabra TaxID=79078 RepID=A0ABU6UCH9_9FABA|nr:hypothetical protein [Stylosanthes scabra]
MMYLFLNNRTLLFILISIAMLMKQSDCTPTYNHHVCSHPLMENATNRDVFQSELTFLLDILSSAASSESFHNTTISTRLYGLFLCRGDVSTKTCENCTITASQEIKSMCAWNSTGVIWYDECMVRYSKENFFGEVQIRPLTFIWNTNENNRTSPFENHLDAEAVMCPSINQLKNNASDGNMLFNSRKPNVNNEYEGYGFVQCTRDINRTSCGSCLYQLLEKTNKCCRNRVGWRLLAPSCNIRYEKYLFFEDSLEPLVSPTPKPQPPSQEPPYNRKNFKFRIIIMVITITTCGLFYLIWCLSQLWERRQEGEGFTDVIRVNNLISATSLCFKGQGMNVTHEDNKGEVQYFSLSTIKVATNSFSDDTKLGEGGFGPVFKVILSLFNAIIPCLATLNFIFFIYIFANHIGEVK